MEAGRIRCSAGASEEAFLEIAGLSGADTAILWNQWCPDGMVNFVPQRANTASKADNTHGRVLAWITANTGDHQRLVVPTREIANALGVSQSVAYYHVRALAKAGSLLVHARGRAGMELRLPSTSQRRQRGRAAQATGSAANRPGAKFFCPWCGTPAQSSWKHCTECGKQLPWANASMVRLGRSEPRRRR